MSDYFCLELGREVVHEIFREEPGDDYWNGLDHQGTTPLGGLWPTLTIRYDDRMDLPDYFASGGKPVVSDRFRLLCEQFHVLAEYLPLRIFPLLKGRPSPTTSFWVLHPLERIDCIDVEASDFEMYGTPPNFTVKRYRKLVFRPQAIGMRAVFRPQHDAALYASSEFRVAAEAQKLWVNFSTLPGT